MVDGDVARRAGSDPVLERSRDRLRWCEVHGRKVEETGKGRRDKPRWRNGVKGFFHFLYASGCGWLRMDCSWLRMEESFEWEAAAEAEKPGVGCAGAMHTVKRLKCG